MTLQLINRTVVIENVQPELDGGRYAVKREVGDVLEVTADIFKEGHDTIVALLKYREKDSTTWQETPMSFIDNDRWGASFPLQRNTRYIYTIEAWSDAFETWRSELQKKLGANLNVDLELLEGRQLLEQAMSRANESDAAELARLIATFNGIVQASEKAGLMLSVRVQRLVARCPDKKLSTLYDRELEVIVDRVKARFAAWYEMFPRSQGTIPGKGATFKDCERRLPEVKAMGFDVVYLVPIHPIGRTHRKGKNNSLEAGPADPGSPYAIGSEEGGHTAVHPELGTLEDFRHFVSEARKHDMELALDFAIQCSPDHPYIKQHPDWFKFRPDGTIKYAENPPKKYQDIVNVNFYGEHRDALWREWRDVLLFWVEQGVKIFRVDNPHTKPFQFWEWCIGEIQHKHPDVIFLSEAFTRPKVLKLLAKAGFTQSYTYFTWRNFKQELVEYLEELTQTPVKEYLRPHFFTNTPDISPPFLQTGGRPAFQIRVILAATLSSVYGIYNGYELCEATSIPGTEEYLNSEKYEYKVWDWDRPGNIKEYIAKLNRIRFENMALWEFDNLRFYNADSEHVLFYGKMTPDQSNRIFIAVNLDPFEPHTSKITFPLEAMGISEDKIFQIENLLNGDKHFWRGSDHTITLDPKINPAAIYRVTDWTHYDYVETCF